MGQESLIFVTGDATVPGQRAPVKLASMGVFVAFSTSICVAPRVTILEERRRVTVVTGSTIHLVMRWAQREPGTGVLFPRHGEVLFLKTRVLGLMTGDAAFARTEIDKAGNTLHECSCMGGIVTILTVSRRLVCEVSEVFKRMRLALCMAFSATDIFVPAPKR